MSARTDSWRAQVESGSTDDLLDAAWSAIEAVEEFERSAAVPTPPTERRIRIHDGEKDTLAEVYVTADNNGTLTSGDLPHGHLFIEVDGKAHGSLLLRQNPDGTVLIENGQYDPTFDQWAPQNPTTEEVIPA